MNAFFYLQILTVALHLPVLAFSTIAFFRGFIVKKSVTIHSLDSVICLTSFLLSATYMRAQITWILKNRDSQITDLESIEWMMFDLTFPIVIILILIRISIKGCRC